VELAYHRKNYRLLHNQRQEALTDLIVRDAEIRDAKKSNNDPRVSRIAANKLASVQLTAAAADTNGDRTHSSWIGWRHSKKFQLVVIALNIMYFASIYREANVNQVSAPSSLVPSVFPYALQCNRIQRPPNKRVTLSLRFKIK
jgi:hypothetical protein